MFRQVCSAYGIGALIATAGASVLPMHAAPMTPDEPPAAATSPPSSPSAKKPLNLKAPVEATLADRLAKLIIAASPVADPSDPKARDEAAQRLADCNDLIEAAGNRILWGGFHPEQGYDPAAYRLHDRSRDDFFQLTEFSPLVWAKLYLSTFMFPGPYQVRQEGRFTVLELDAKFRGGLDPGEYPYPFWHSPSKWTAYMNAEKVLLIFEPGRLVAAMRQSPLPVASRLIKRPWDTKWTWTDEQGQPQPRVTLFKYLFSADNPHVAGLDSAFRELESELREQNCMTCHAPDNQSRINDLLLLNYPNQALIARRTLVAVLEDNTMPPGNELAHEPTGIQDGATLRRLIRLAKAFERNAEAAYAHERLRRALDDQPPQPESPPAAP